jgi:hypothetical protein
VSTDRTPDPRPNDKHPRDKLPTGGAHPYDSANPDGSIQSRRGRKGYVDRDGNVWEWDAVGEHWDVQHADGRHTNIGPDGNVHHGPDNF